MVNYCPPRKTGADRSSRAVIVWCNPPPPQKLLEATVRKIILQMHTPARSSQCWSRQTQHGLGVCIGMHLVTGKGNSPVSGTDDPGVGKQDKSSGGSVDTTKTRLGPQRVRMSSGERPIGAAKAKQPNTGALCQTPSKGGELSQHWGGGGSRGCVVMVATVRQHPLCRVSSCALRGGGLALGAACSIQCCVHLNARGDYAEPCVIVQGRHATSVWQGNWFSVAIGPIPRATQ